jgi:hypothetical protein
MATAPEPTRLLVAVSVAALAATVVVHVLFFPRYFPEEFTRGLPVLAAGWVSYLLFFYTLGRLRPSTDRMPNMRATDIGVGLFLFAIVLSGLLDSAGLTLEAMPSAHLLSVAGVYVGLALAGWGFGTRTRMINRIAAETD